MTNPLPESAVELAARAIFMAEGAGRTEGHWDEFVSESRKASYRRMARAALPAIREAVVGEFKGLVERSLDEAKDLSPDSDTIDACSHRDPFNAYHMGFGDCREAVEEALAALTEQENRNGTER